MKKGKLIGRFFGVALLKRLKLFLGMVITLTLALSLILAVPAYADVGLTKGVTPATPNEYQLGDTIHYNMKIINWGGQENIVVEAVWDVLPDGSTVYPTGPALPYTLTPGQNQSYTYDWVATRTGTVINTFYAHGYQITSGGADDFYMQVSKTSTVVSPPPATYTLAISSTAGGSVTSPGEGIFTCRAGAEVSLVAEAEESYRFVNWIGDVSAVADVNAATTSITMNGDYAINANFELIPPTEYVLTVSSTSGGSVTTPGEGIFIRTAGTVVSLVASPASGYRFVRWTGDVSTIADVNDASTTITMNGDYSVTANFEEIPGHTLTISGSAGGSVTTPGEGDFTYDEGTVVGLEAKPDEGYQFAEWTGDVDTIADVNAATTTITMNDDYSMVANFEQTPASPFGCFIATAAYGTPMAEEIQILHEFRDEYLLTNWLGQGLVEVYYTISPPIADFITDHPGLKPIVRVGLVPVVVMCSMLLDVIPQFAGNEG